MAILLFDDATRLRLYPFTRTRAAADVRCGILTMRERWERLLEAPTGTLTEAYLQPACPAVDASGETLVVNGAVFGTQALADAIRKLERGSKLLAGDVLVAARLAEPVSFEGLEEAVAPLQAVAYEVPVQKLDRVWDIFSKNGTFLRSDFALLTAGRTSVPVPEGVTVTGQGSLFLEDGAHIGAGTVINATAGPVYLAAHAEIMEGCLLRGPVALGAGAVLKLGAKVYGDTTIGPGCKVGGEVSNAVFFANSNKGHDGFVGNCVVGEWCNIGADTNASNLKNNYDGVKIHDDATGKRLATGLTFCGLLMADHSKCGINTMFNTGTVVGVSCNIYGGDFPPSYIPSFAWGGAAGFKTYAFDKALETAGRMMERRHKVLSPEETAVLQHIFDETAAQRQQQFRKTEA